MNRLLMANPLGNTIIIGEVVINATASDDSGIQKVEFFVDGELLATFEEEPYSLAYGGSFGRHTVEVIAYDSWDNTEQSVLNMLVINF